MSSRHPGRTEALWLALARRIVRPLVRLLLGLRVHGADRIPRHGPVLLAGNHTGFLDGPLVFIVLPRPSAFLVKSELYVGAMRWFLDRVDQIPVHRGKPDRQALHRGLAVLADGGVLGMFPEGTRGSGALDAVQHGIGYLAVRAGCPVVPVVCVGTAEALPKGARLPRLRTGVDIVFGEPFTPEVTGDPRSRRTVADVAEQIRRHLVDHLTAAEALTGRSATLPAPAGETTADAGRR